MTRIRLAKSMLIVFGLTISLYGIYWTAALWFPLPMCGQFRHSYAHPSPSKLGILERLGYTAPNGLWQIPFLIGFGVAVCVAATRIGKQL